MFQIRYSSWPGDGPMVNAEMSFNPAGLESDARNMVAQGMAMRAQVWDISNARVIFSVSAHVTERRYRDVT